MQMIPDYVEWFPSGAERMVHELLSGCPRLEGYALHSLNVARHRTKIWGEIDFILVRPFGIIALEIKGSQLLREGGRWYQRDIRNGDERAIESPIDQVRNSVFPVVEDLRSRGVQFGAFGWGYVTPECMRLPPSPESPAEMQAAHDDCQNEERFSSWIKGLETYWVQQLNRHHSKLSSGEMGAIARALRPDCDLAVPLGKRIESVGERMKRFTEEQFTRLDEISENDRILCRGGAGTGKTFLAMEVMRREIARGKRCLYVARSQRLIEFLRSGRAGMDLMSFSELRTASVSEPWDVLVVDEGQDLLGLEFLEILDAALDGGLDHGRWRWFMDDYHQAGFHGDVDPDAIQLLDSRGATLQRLKVNCRNTRQVVRFAQLATGADIGEARLRGDGPRAEYRVVEEGREKKALLLRIREWLKEDVPPQSIVVLTCAEEVDGELVASLPKHVQMFPVREFKGLESDCVALIGIGPSVNIEDLGAHLYTGLTRARVSAWLAIPESRQEEWEGITKRNLEKIMEAHGE